MKSKLVLLLIAAVGSTALVASAQTQTSSYVVTTRSSEGQDPFATATSAAPAPAPAPVPQPPVPPVPPPIATSPPARNTFFYSRPQYISYSVEENNLSHQAEQFAQQLAAARSDSDREKIKGQLTELLEKQFDQRQKKHEEEIKQLEAQIKKLKDTVDKRQENRREIIGARLNQIVKESQGLGW
jgi:colicin import membrane protein